MKKAAGLMACAMVLAGASAFLLYHLGREPLQDYDEATYTQVVHEALVNHHYLSYTEGGANYFKKPPLAFWVMEVSETLLGENTFAQRLPFVLFGIATVAALMLLVYEASASTWTAALAGAVLATTAPFMETARQVRTDTLVVFFIVLAVYAFLKGLKNPKWFLAFGAAVGLAAMSKSVIAVFALVAAFFILLLYRRFDLFKNKYTYLSAGMFLLVAAPWHLWEWARFGNDFWAQYIGVEVVNRAQENLFWTVTITNADYVNYLQQFTQPWLCVFFIALLGALAAWKWLPLHNRRVAFASAATMAVMVIVFFTAKTKAPTYLLPLYPFAAAVIALAVASIRPLFWRVAAGVVFALLLLSGVYTTYYNAYHINPYYSIELDMAKDEQIIAQPLVAIPKTTPVYVYDDENLGSISYYSQHLYLLTLTATSTPAAGSYVIVDTSGLPLLAQNFKTLQTQTVYSGPQVSLVQIQN